MSKRKHSSISGKTKAQTRTKSAKTSHAMLKSQIVRELGAREIHYKNFQINQYDILSADVVTQAMTQAFNLVPVEGTFSFVGLGDDINQRTSRKIAINSFKMHYSIFYPQVTGNTTQDMLQPDIRMILAIDENCNGEVPNSNADRRLLSDNGFWSFMSTNAFGKYKVLKDFTIRAPLTRITEPSSTTFNLSPQVKSGKIKYKFKKPLVVQFNTNAAQDIREIQTNNLFMMVFDNSANTATAPVLDGVARIAFTDF